MKIYVASYKQSGKFYSDGTVEINKVTDLFNTEYVATAVRAVVPLLEDGYIVVYGVDELFNHLYKADELREYL